MTAGIASDRPPLSDLMADVVSSAPSPAGVRHSLELFHGIAQSYLQTWGGDRYLPARLGASFDDLAYDALCHFFQRDPEGTFPRVRQALAGGPGRARHEEELLGTARRAIAEYLEREIVRRIKEADSSLDRILRNVRNAVHGSPILRDVASDGAHWAVVGGAEELSAPRPLMPLDLLEEALVPYAGPQSTVPSLVARAGATLRDQAVYRRAIAFDALAVVLQNVYVRAGCYALAGPGCGGERHAPELERTVLRSVAEVESRMRRPLMVKEGIPGTTYAQYMKAAAEILRTALQASPDAALSYYRILEKHLTGLNRAAYLRYHRGRLEFIVRSVRQRYVENVRNV